MKKANTRVRRSPEQWQALIDQQQSSGLPASRFCEQQGLNYNLFRKWRRRLTAEVDQQSNLVDITGLLTERQKPVWEVELDLGDGMMLRLRRG